jgi:enoyl-CoA hydratase
MSGQLVHLSVTGAVATITLDSYHNRNALSRQLVSELSDSLRLAEGDPTVGVVLLRSAHRVFCSGADLSEATDGSTAGGPLSVVELQRQLLSMRCPVVVQLDGAVRAGGLGLVAAADIVVAADTVTFQLSEVRLALAPAAISPTLLGRLPSRVAADLFLTARVFSATEAADYGLVTTAVAETEVADAIRRTLDDITLGDPQGLREAKALLNGDIISRIDERGNQLARRSQELFDSPAAQALIRRLKSAK